MVDRFSIENSGHCQVVSRLGVATSTPMEALTVNGVVTLQEKASYSTSYDGYGSIFSKTDGYVYYYNDHGVEYNLTLDSIQ
jgi:hypothetical protein